MPLYGAYGGDIYQLPDDQQWDIVICSHTIEHVPEPLAFCRRLRELARHRVFVAAPFEERADILTNGHINIFDEAFLQEFGPLSVARVKFAAWGAFLDPPYEMFIAELEGVGLPDDLGPGSVQLVEPNSATIPGDSAPGCSVPERRVFVRVIRAQRGSDGAWHVCRLGKPVCTVGHGNGTFGVGSDRHAGNAQNGGLFLNPSGVGHHDLRLGDERNRVVR